MEQTITTPNSANVTSGCDDAAVAPWPRTRAIYDCSGQGQPSCRRAMTSRAGTWRGSINSWTDIAKLPVTYAARLR